MIFLVASHTARHNARSGIQTVTRSLAAGLIEAVPVSWFKRGAYLHTLQRAWTENLGRPLEPERLRSPSLRHWPSVLLARGLRHRLPLHRHPEFFGHLAGAWLLMPELAEAPEIKAIIRYARRHGLRTATIFHDAIPLQRPDLTNRTAAAHAAYLDALNGCDLVLAVSAASAAAFVEFGGRVPVRVCALPAEMIGAPRVLHEPEPSETMDILCVSTLEPRKNHQTLLAAFEIASKGSKLMTLHLAGDRYEKRDEVADMVEAATHRNFRIRWHERPGPALLANLYRWCDFTVYPSFLEGFGLPVVESLWFAKPCICADFGVMAENAVGGGCLTTDVRCEQSLARAIEALATSPERRRELSREAIARPLRTWSQYADAVREALHLS